MSQGKPVPRDLLFFLSTSVFPHAPRARPEELLHCSKVMLLPEGGEAREPGLYIVYNGSVSLDGYSYERGDYFILERGRVARAASEAIVIYAPPGCGEDLARLGRVEPCRVRDLVLRPPVTASPKTSVRSAVAVMHREGVSSIVVVDAAGRPLGVFTDTDLRRLVAIGASLESRLESVMTPDPVGVPEDTTCMDAVRVMMERNIKHLLVLSGDGRLRGVVTVRDIAYAEALGPLYMRRLVDKASTVGELAEAYRRLTSILRRHATGLHPAVGRGSPLPLIGMASLALRSVVSRAAHLAAKRLGIGGEGWAYLVLGSNARLEQALPTDRDTALVYTSLPRSQAVKLAEETEDILDRIGFPGCSHGYTARSLVYSLDELLDTLSRYARSPQGDREIVMIGLFMDATAAYPPASSSVAEKIRVTLAGAVHEAGSGPYLRQVLAAYRPRLGALGRLPRRIDLKRDGVAPIVFAVKALAVSSGLWEPVATRDRLEALAARGQLSGELAAEAAEALGVLLGFTYWSMVVHGSRELETGELSGVERSLLRGALQAAARLVDRARGLG